jgi:hypothetical protein
MVQNKKKKTIEPQDQGSELDNVCFVISPIGKEGTDTYNKFKESLDYVIKPAIESSSLNLKVIRADEINRSGSFIKDILEQIFRSFLVMVDLTDQNPNVFYELGVRHSLSPRTILIAQTLDDIPSDLREYRTIIYNTSAKGSHDFRKKIHDYINEIKLEPHRPDNPVLDRLPQLMEQKQSELEDQIGTLKNQLSNILSKGTPEKMPAIKGLRKTDIDKRLKRILTLMNAQYQRISGGRFTKTIEKETIDYKIPHEQGNFNLYFLISADGNAINDYWYISADSDSDLNIEEELADIRVLIERCSEGQDVDITFIIATDLDLSKSKSKIQKGFDKVLTFIDKSKIHFFSLEIWDKKGLEDREKALGIRIEI